MPHLDADFQTSYVPLTDCIQLSACLVVGDNFICHSQFLDKKIDMNTHMPTLQLSADVPVCASPHCYECFRDCIGPCKLVIVYIAVIGMLLYPCIYCTLRCNYCMYCIKQSCCTILKMHYHAQQLKNKLALSIMEVGVRLLLSQQAITCIV